MYSFCWRRLASGELDAVPEEMRIEGAFRHLALRPSSAARVDDQQDGAPDARGAAWQRPPPLTHHRHAPGQVVILSMQQSSGLLHSRARGAGAGRHREAMSDASRRSRRIPRPAACTLPLPASGSRKSRTGPKTIPPKARKRCRPATYSYPTGSPSCLLSLSLRAW